MIKMYLIIKWLNMGFYFLAIYFIMHGFDFKNM